MKKILIVGAGFLQTFVIKKANEIGYYTIAIDKNPDSIGFKYADEHHVVDIVDQNACLNFAVGKDLDGVMTAATDYGVLSAARIAQQLNLPGLEYNVAQQIKNKYLFRRILFQHKADDISQYYEIKDLNEVRQMSEKIRFPVMVKPCDGSGSKAVKRVDSKNQLEVACAEAIDVSLIKKALIEDFIEGKEYGVESFVFNGEIHVLGIMNKWMTNPPDYAELGHMMPSKLAIEELVKTKVKNAINALDINFGAVNMDIIITKDNKICIIDIGARMGGNLIGSHIIPIGTGIDYLGDLIKASVGDQIDLMVSIVPKCVVTKILALKPGKVVALPDFDRIQNECNVLIFHQLEKGTEIKEYHNNLDGCGYVMSVSENEDVAIRNVEYAKRLIDDGIVRE